MHTLEATAEIDASPEAIWRIVLAYERWPEWSPLFQLVEPETPEIGLNGEWKLNGFLGRIPYTGTFHQVGHRPLEAFAFASISLSPPYDFIRHTVLLKRNGPVPLVTWRIEYRMSGGPGGWIVDRLLVRRNATTIASKQLSALCDSLDPKDEHP